MNTQENINGREVSYYTKKMWKFFLIFISFIFLLIVAAGFGLFGTLPTFKELENPKSSLASEVLSSDQVVLGTYYVQNRSNSKFKELSPNLVNALIATEDVRFYDHSGIDLRGTFAIVAYTLIGKKRGSSTITQQLAKNLFPRQHQNIFTIGFIKLKEWLTAVKIERNYTKEEIITMYFNTVNFGNNSYGIKAAAKTYFSTTPDKLNVPQSAMLVGILKGTSFFSPIKNPDRALVRRNTVMIQMEKYGFITEQELEKHYKDKLNLSYQSPQHNDGLATYFREMLRQELLQFCKENKKPDGENYDLYRDGLKIYTTINSKMQRYAEEAMQEHLTVLQKQFFEHWKGKGEPWGKFLEVLDQAKHRSDRYKDLKNQGYSKDSIEIAFNTKIPMKIFSWQGDIDTTMSPMDSIKYYKYFLLSGFMSMEPQTGFVKAWVGGPDYEYFQYDHVRLGKRQVGSTFKPFVYTIAMDNGWSPCFEAPNLPVTFEDFDNYTPRNADRKDGGMLTLRKGLANSVNNVTAYLMKQIGPQSVVNLVKKLGITSDVPPYPSICLGTCDISLYEMVGAFSAYANKGVYIEPTYLTRIEDKNGNILFEKIPKKVDAISEQTAYLMLYMLKGVVDGGTGSRIRGSKYKIPYPIAGKTGTTQNNSDGWFMGITPDLVSGVWTGAEDRAVHFRSLNLGEGANTALPIWALYMNKVYADPTITISKKDFAPPKNGLGIEIDCSKYKEEQLKNVNPALDF